MTWQKINKRFFTSDEPIVTLNNSRFSFNKAFSKLAELEKNRYVTYYLDEENRKIGFEFSSIETEGCFKVTLNKDKGDYSQSKELFELPWVRKTSLQKELSRFKSSREGKKHVITLFPVFENCVSRKDYLKIPSSASGIYRYLDNSNIVYIGRGNVRSRLGEPLRKEWKFDTIEFSIILDDVLLQQWESFWINDFKHKNFGVFPAYNLISGKNKD